MAAAIMRGGAGLAARRMIGWEMFQMTVEILGKGRHEHYEIANFARPGRQCRHNPSSTGKTDGTWESGRGPHSHWERRRWANVKDPGTLRGPCCRRDAGGGG